MRVIVVVTAGLLFSITFSGALLADRGVGSIDLSANPSALAADGKSVCTVTARVRDSEGVLVPDDTEVRFSASMGVIEETAGTSSGVARVKLVSSDIPGTCVVAATWVEGEAAAQISIEFGDAAPTVKGPAYISVDAEEYLAYSVDYKVLEALGSVKVRYRSLELEAGEVQVDLGKNRIVARGTGQTKLVGLRTADGVITGNIFTCDLAGSGGLLLSAETGAVHRVTTSGGAPKLGDEETSYMPEDFDMADLSDSSVLVKAKRATVFPNEKIQFKGASVYVDGKRMLSLPLYVLSLTGYQPEDEQYLGYSTGGITVNLPVYYSLSSSSSGALLVRHGPSAGWGWYGQKPGWFVDMRQKYSTEKSQGTLVLSRVTGGDWGAHFSHSQDLGNRTHAYLYLDYPAHRDFYGNLDLSRSFDGFNVGLSVYKSSYEYGGDSMDTDLHVQTRARAIGGSSLRYTLSGRLAYSVRSGDGISGSDDEDFSQSVRGNLYTVPIALSQALSFKSSVSLGYMWGDSRVSGLSTQANAVLDWKLSKYSSFCLSYKFTEKPSIYTSRTSTSIYTGRTGKQSLSAYLRLGDGRKWRATLSAIKGLDYASVILFGDLSYRLDDRWRLGVRSTLNEFSNLSYDDFELALGRKIGNRELMAVWSKSQRKIMFELGSAGL